MRAAWARPLLALILVSAAGLAGFELILPDGRASDSFYTASATVAAALFVALTVAARPIFQAAPPIDGGRRSYIIAWSCLVGVGFVFNAGAGTGSLAALNHCKPAKTGQSLCGNAF